MAERLKDMFFTESSINDMAEAIKKYYPGFDKKKKESLDILKNAAPLIKGV